MTQPGSRSSAELAEILKTLLSSVSDSLKHPVCKSLVTLDLRSDLIRTREVKEIHCILCLLTQSCLYYSPQLGTGSQTLSVMLTMTARRSRILVVPMEYSSALARFAEILNMGQVRKLLCFTFAGL